MSSPQQNIHKGSRRSAKKSSGNASRMVVSETEASNPLISHTPNGESKARQRRKSQAAKKGAANSDVAAHSDSQTQRSTSQPVKTQATPIKQQAYAGPTFHQSPAASALPLPSFYSRSLPNAGLMKPVPGDSSRPHTQDSVPNVPSPPVEVKRESTPLDFLFEAARKAHATPDSGTPHQHRLPVSGPGTPYSRSPGFREPESEFPFEMESTDKTPDDGYLTFSTPYKDRIEALTSNRSASEGGRTIDNTERAAKTAALKKFLMNSAQIKEEANDNPFNARPVPPPTVRHHSNPSTPLYNAFGNGSNNHQYLPPPQYFPAGPISPGPRSQGSNLRNIYAPDASPIPAELSSDSTKAESRISTARDQTPVRAKYASSHLTPPPSRARREQSSTPSAQQLEDDLRRVLKLDLGS